MQKTTDMKLLYINDELATGDGSNSHAVGMLRAFESILGKNNVVAYPQPQDGSSKPVNLGANKLKSKLRAPLAVVRYFRKKYLSMKKCKEICRELTEKEFTPTHILARSTDFDVTAIHVAKRFHAKLIYEVNTPMFYERGVLKKEPMVKQIEAWEKSIIDAADFVYVVSNICRDMLCDHYHVPKEKFLVIPNGYMGELYHESDGERKKIREKIRANEGLTNKFVVTFVGSLKIWHGIQSFCDTAQAMKEEKDVIFLVLGDGEMHDMIADYAKTHSNMIFKGKVNLETMKEYLYASDLGIMPYEKKENFYYSPLKMYDMIGAGLPFIGTSVGQIEEYSLSELSDAFLCNNPSVDSFCAEIRNLKSNSIKLENMQHQVNERKEYASWERRSQNLLRAIQ